MFRNTFREPKPQNHVELIEAIDETGLDTDTAWAQVEHNVDDRPEFNGWTADINDDEGNQIGTLAWASKDDLVADLKSVGIDNIEYI